MFPQQKGIMHSMLECPYYVCDTTIPKMCYYLFTNSVPVSLNSSLDRVRDEIKKDKAINKYKRCTDERPERRKIGRKEMKKNKKKTCFE